MLIRVAKVILLSAVFIFLSGCANKANIANNQSAANPTGNLQQASLSSEPRREIKILFVGDIMFDRYIRQVAQKHGNDYNYPLLPIKNFLSQFDLVVGNLEGPITENASRSVDTQMDEKSNLVFTFDPKSAGALANNNIKLVNLGNNHILNQGESGLLETKKYLDEAGVEYFGDTGLNESRAFVKKLGGMKIGFVNYNYSAQGSDTGVINNIEGNKKLADLTIVCPHWGTEFKVGDPGEAIRTLAHQFIDAGADAIVGTHPHVIQNSEEYKGKKIYYSLGNFLFDQYFQKETMEGLGVILTIEPDLAMKYDEVKFEMTRNGQTKVEP